MEIVPPLDSNSSHELNDTLNKLIDIGVNEVESDRLLDSRCKARIQVNLAVMPGEFWPRYLDFFLSHLKGRGAVGSVLDDGTLLITFGVADASEASQQLVHEFANDIVEVLGQSESAISEAEIHEMTDERLRRSLADLGIRFSRPNLTIVSDSSS